MGMMDKFLNAMRLNDVEEDYDAEEYYEEEEVAEKPSKKVYEVVDDDTEEEFHEPKKKALPSKNNNNVTPMRAVRKGPGNGMEVCVIKPTTVDESKEITETLLDNRTVILNLEGLDVDIAQRIIDFASGSTYAINGNLQKISNFIFIITPATVDISGDFQEIFSGTFDVPPISHN